MSAIEDLFNGKIYPSERVQSTSKLYQSSKIAAMALSQKLTNSLSSEQREWFDTYCTEGALMNSEMYLLMTCSPSLDGADSASDGQLSAVPMCG